MSNLHFEDLWEKCEKFNKDSDNLSTIDNLMDDLLLKINLYKAIEQKNEVPENDRKKIKSRILGEILLTLTNLSLKDDINVFEALNTALQYRSVEFYSQKY